MMVGSVTTHETRSLSLFSKEDQQIKSDIYVVSIGHVIIIAATEIVLYPIGCSIILAMDLCHIDE